MTIKRALIILLVLAFLPSAVMAQLTTRATIEVTKTFLGHPANSTKARVYLDCNTSIIPDHEDDFDEDVPQTWVLTGFDHGDLDCTVYEDVIPGYAGFFYCDNDSERPSDVGWDCTDDSYSASYWEDNEVPAPVMVEKGQCFFYDIEDGDELECEIENRLLAVRIDVEKVWIDEHPEFGNPTYARGSAWCENASRRCGLFESVGQGSSDSASEVDGVDGYGHGHANLTWYQSGDVDSVLVCPAWWQTTYCGVDERVRDSAVESEDDCDFSDTNSIAPGDWNNECTVTNTRIYEGVPTLSQYGLALMALLMIGVGLVGFRRFA